MFDTTREELANTLTEYGYLLEPRGDRMEVYTEDLQLIAEFHVNDDVVISGEYLTAYEWYNDTPDGAVEYLAILANMDSEDDELADFTMAGDDVENGDEDEDEDY